MPVAGGRNLSRGAAHCVLVEHERVCLEAIDKNIEKLGVGEHCEVVRLPFQKALPVLLKSRENANLNTVMSNTFGFGGTNACIVFQRHTP